MTLDRAQREFLAESAEIVDHLSAGLAEIDRQRKSGPPSPAKTNEIFRYAHSLKGLAGMFGIDAMSRLAHQLETLFDGLRLGRVVLTDDTMELVYACTDLFARLLADLKDGRESDAATVAAITARLATASKPRAGAQSAQHGELRLAPEALAALTEYEEHRLAENLRLLVPVWRVHAPLALASFETELTQLNTVIAEVGEIITTLPSTDDTGKFIIFDIVFATSIAKEQIAMRVLPLGNYAVERVDGAPVLKRAAPSLPLNLANDDDIATLHQMSDTVRVDIRKLDELMGIVGELVLARGGLARVTNELKSEIGYQGLAVDLHRLVRTLERRIVDLQTAIMQVRMVPLGQVFERMARTIRRTATTLGKEVEFDVVGEETELDKLIVQELVDPLMHLARNAIDHGIETPELRVANGKSPAGRLRVVAFPRGNHVIIEVSDDGRGIDEVSVKRTALERGVVDEEHVGQLTRGEVWNLIFAPGFSTRKEVTETSGRGVGLDVVKTNVSKMSGLIDVESQPGRGTKFTITLPITLAIIQAVIIRCAARVYALPLASVLEIVEVQQADLRRIEGKEMLELRGQTLPVLRLDGLFHPGEGSLSQSVDGAVGFAAVVGLAQHRAALLIEDVLGQQDIVIKSLGAFLGRARGIAGATHLGDHETILVLDVGALVSERLISDDGRTRTVAA